MKIDKVITLNESGFLEEVPVIELEKGIVLDLSEIKDIKKNIEGKISNKNHPFKKDRLSLYARASFFKDLLEKKEKISPEKAEEILSSFHIELKDLEKSYIGFPKDQYPTFSFIFKESWCMFKKLYEQRKFMKRRTREFRKMKSVKC